MRAFSVVVILSCLVLLTGVAGAQSTRSAEGISRQLLSVKNMIENFAEGIRARVQAVENDVDAVETRMDTVESDVASVLATIATHETRLNSHDSSLSSHGRRIKVLEDREPTGGGGTAPTPSACNGRNMSWGGGCNAYVQSLPDGGAVVLRDQVSGDVCTNRQQHVGQIRVACNNGQLSTNNASCEQRNVYNANQCGGGTPTPKKRCAAKAVSWQNNAGTVTCRANLVAADHDSTRRVTYDNNNTRPGQNRITGHANFVCDNGVFKRTSKYCQPQKNPEPPKPCASKSVSWTSNGVTCRGTVSNTPNGLTSSVTDPDRTRECENVIDTTGSASFRCTNGSFKKVSGSCRQVRSRRTGDCR